MLVSLISKNTSLGVPKRLTYNSILDASVSDEPAVKLCAGSPNPELDGNEARSPSTNPSTYSIADGLQEVFSSCGSKIRKTPVASIQIVRASVLSDASAISIKPS